MRLLPATLRWRLVASAAALVAFSFVITFVAVYQGTGSSLSHQIDRDLAGDADTFSQTLGAAGGRSSRGLRQSAERYVSSLPYTGTSTLLFALVPGAAPATNQPELLSTDGPPDEGETETEQSRENRAAALLFRAPSGYSTVELPDVGRLRLLIRRVTVPGGPDVMVGVGEPLATVARAQAGVARAFMLAGILVLICALTAAYLLGTSLSAPLRRLSGVATRVSAGDLQPRIEHLEGAPEEVLVMAGAFNHMLDRLSEAFAAQRAFVADASHELRTPLTVIRGQLELLAHEEQPSREEIRRVNALVQAEIARISRLVDDLLLLAKAERSEFLRTRSFALPEFVAELWEGAQLLAERRFVLGDVPAGSLDADPDRLTQALRNLLVNAVEHTRAPDGLVRLSVVAHKPPTSRHGERSGAGRSLGAVRFIVDDDGPGIPADQRERIFHRFHRTDSGRDRASGGAGLGLAIVRAIAESHGGRVFAGESPEGGARIELELPGFTAAPDGAGVGGDGGGQPNGDERPATQPVGLDSVTR